MSYEDDGQNLAESLSKLLPTPSVVYPPQPQPGDILRVAVPKNFELKDIDTEKLLPGPRRAMGTASFDNPDSFLAYIQRHANAQTMCWCSFDPQTFALDFTAVIDDHGPAGEATGWRSHRAYFKPDMSVEWKAWKPKDRHHFGQVEFAEWIQEHEQEITTPPDSNLPTSLQMLDMATNFTANEERQLKSAVKLQSGGVRLTYIADPNEGTTSEMRLFEKFAIGIPVFHGGQAYQIDARLKYRPKGPSVTFFYELVRADRVHAAAANGLIATVKAGLGTVPLVMGKFA